MTQQDFQLNWPKAELDRIATRIQTDYRAALADHNRRIKRWREYYRRFRAMVNLPNEGEETAANLPVPYVRWNVLTKWAKEMDALFGDDAEIVAVPVGASDYKRDAKVSKYMTWRVFNSMKLVPQFCAFVLFKLVFGRVVAYSPWKTDSFDVPAPEGKAFYNCKNCGRDALGDEGAPPQACEHCQHPLTGKESPKDEGEVVEYEGPDFVPLWPDDFIVPAEEVSTLHEFSFCLRKYRATPDQLLRGEEKGRYRGIKEHWETILNMAQHGIQREYEGDEVKQEKDDAEGILYQRPLSSGESLLVLEWYGRWRPLKSGVKDAAEWDFKKREMRQREFVVRYLWDLRLVIGVQDLAQLYPTKRNRRPFTEASMFKDGTYWSPGMAELLIDIEDELCANHNQATEAGQLAINPPIAYRPGSGMNPETFKIEPGLAIPLDNPATDVIQLKIGANMDIAQWKEQCVLAYGEKLTGMSDLQMGRQSDRPNAPRTAKQTVALLEEGNVRISLDNKVLREDMSGVLSHFWDLEYIFSSPQTFFRVTEDDADGIFETNNGGSILTLEDRDGRYDFRLQFASSVHSREAKKEQALARYQLDLQNPLVVQNPQALWEATRAAHEALDDPDFAKAVPKPPAPDVSIDPKDEWVELLHGEDVHVNPADNDQAHLVRHMKDLQMSEQNPNGPTGDLDAVKKLIAHYHDHIQQLQMKKLQQAIVEQAAQAVQQLAGKAKPLRMPQGLFGGPVTEPAGNPAAEGPNIYSGHPEVMHEQ
jgi:DNA-directed RNA polymerase subunit RPC12/RpoP